jgi:tetratricopeptide (TPR) repeat protein
VPAGTVSVAQLLHPPGKKAVEAFLAARKLSDAGNYAQAAEQLEGAVRTSPEFADAWINLAAQHLRLGQYQQALDELSRAAEIAKPNAVLLNNMACAQHSLHRDQEAIFSAREALRLDKSYAPAHLLLGSVLAADRRTLTEALAHLEIAVRTYPAAQEFLERVRSEIAQTVSHP